MKNKMGKIGEAFTGTDGRIWECVGPNFWLSYPDEYARESRSGRDRQPHTDSEAKEEKRKIKKAERKGTISAMISSANNL